MSRYAISVLLAVAFVVCTAVATLGQTANLVANPGLETDADGDGMPDHWSASDPSQYPANWEVGGGNAIVQASDTAHTGAHSIMYRMPEPVYPPVVSDEWWDYGAWEFYEGIAQGHWAVAFKTDNFPVKEYHLYRCRCWVRAEDILKLHIKFVGTYVYPGRDEPVERWIHPVLHGPNHSSRKTGTWDWQMWETLVPVPEFVEQGRIEFWIREWGAPAKLYADDLSVTEVRAFPYFERRRLEL